MSSLGWGPTLILVIGITLVIGGIAAFISEMVRKSKAHKRDMRKLLASLPAEKRGRFAVGMDVKTVGSWNEDIE